LDQSYTITDTALSYTIPAFTVVPDSTICIVVYSLKIKDLGGTELPCPTCFNPQTLLFAFYHDSDLLLSGATFKDYIVEVTGITGENTPTTEVATFNLRINNPCIDPSFVSI